MPSDAMMSELKRQSAEMNMTPMIDVVFQLIIFFMLVMEITQQDLELLKLPIAENARPDKKPPAERLTLNVAWEKGEFRKPEGSRDGSKFEYRIQGSLVRPDELYPRLQRHAQRNMDPGPPITSNMPVLIRCDIDIEYRAVLKALVECMKARIWKIELAIRERE